MSKSFKLLNYTVHAAWATALMVFLYGYSRYVKIILTWPFDWEPTDGDHLNFVLRILKGLPIYASFRDGDVLSIYNPLYHYVLAGLASVSSVSMITGRAVSVVCVLSCSAITFMYLKKQIGKWCALVAAIWILLPAQHEMLLDLFNVNPNAMMALFFLLSMCLIGLSYSRQSFELYLLSGLACALTFLAKQQGVIAVVIGCSFFVLHRTRVKFLGAFLLSFSALVLTSTAYLELSNNQQFLKSVLFDLSKIMFVAEGLANTRLMGFLINNIGFSLCAVAAIIIAVAQRRLPTVWQIGLVLHVPLLLKTLGNPGGGPNYFFTFWICLVFTCVEFIYNNQFEHERLKRLFTFMLLLNSAGAGLYLYKDLSHIQRLDQSKYEEMSSYYSFVQDLVNEKPMATILTNRNVGSLVLAGYPVDNEGATEFNYAWRNPTIFNKNKVLEAIRQKKYDYVFLGFQKYPVDFMPVLEAQYSVLATQKANIVYGDFGGVLIYASKK